jgi:hypothetical protein
MVQLYGKDVGKKELLRRVGDISQIGGIRLLQLDDGPMRGVRAAEVRTGGGLTCTVVLDRGMDISFAEYQGVPLGYRSPTGEIAPAFYEPEGFGWLRGFHSGLLVTCGLAYMGAPCVDEGEPLGLHGRISYIPAAKVGVGEGWQGDDYVMSIKGELREVAVFGENLRLTRRISATLGEPRLRINDRVENLGYQESPLMILYHFNFGYPLLDEESEIIAPGGKATPRDAEAAADGDRYTRLGPPLPGYKERVFLWEMKADAQGWAKAGLANRAFGNGHGLGVLIRYRQKELPCFTDWKMIGEGLYVVGLEPGNAYPLGRVAEREAGRLQHLGPGEEREFALEIEVLDGNRSIDETFK